MTKKDELKVKQVEAKIDGLKKFVVTSLRSGYDSTDYFIAHAKDEDEALRKVAKKLYDSEREDEEEEVEGDYTFEEYLDNCLHTDMGNMLECYEPVEVF
jgi:predicted transcriptional regulator YdeE